MQHEERWSQSVGLRLVRGRPPASSCAAALETRRVRKFRRGDARRSLADHVGREAQKPGALDRLGEFAQFVGALTAVIREGTISPRSETARQQAHVLVADLRRVERRKTGTTCDDGKRGGGASWPSDCSSYGCILTRAAGRAISADSPIATIRSIPTVAVRAVRAIVAIALLALAQHSRRSGLMLGSDAANGR